MDRWTRVGASYVKGDTTITRERGIANHLVWIARDANGRQVARQDSLAACKRQADAR